MSTVSIPEAKTQLSELIDLAQQGEDTIIVREGKPVARLSGLDAGNKTIRYGALKDSIWIAEDFDEPLSEDFFAKVWLLMPSVLLDTHIFLWLTANDVRLTPQARQQIEAAEAVFISAASVWEVAIKVRLGKLKVGVSDVIDEIHNNGFIELPVTSRHAQETTQLPMLHGDPFDRLLIGQAISQGFHLLTADAHLVPYSGLVVQV